MVSVRALNKEGATEDIAGSSPASDTKLYPQGVDNMEKSIEMYGGKIYGVALSDYGLEKGYLDFKTLASILEDCILNNTLRDRTMSDWEIVAGEFDDMVMSDYIISEYGYKFLKEYTDELVFYNENLDIYIWAVTRWGTRWDYELTNTKLVEMNNVQ